MHPPYNSPSSTLFPQPNRQQQGHSCNKAMLKVHQIQSYIASVFTACALPPLDQLLELEVDDEMCAVRVDRFDGAMLGGDGDWLYYVQAGTIVLRKCQGQQSEDRAEKNIQIEKSGKGLGVSTGRTNYQSTHRANEEIIQVKEGSFFVLREFHHRSDPQQLQIYDYQKNFSGHCRLGRIKFNNSYNFDWYTLETKKYHFLSSLFQHKTTPVAEHKIKGLSRFFVYQKFRKGVILTQEGEQNKRLMFIARGDCQYSKKFTYSQKNYLESKIINIGYGTQGTVLGSEFLLFQYGGGSKSATSTTMALAELPNDKLNFHVQTKSASNFTASVASAFAQIYYIEVPRFLNLCQRYVPQIPGILRQAVQSHYVTLLRTTKQRISLEVSKIKRNEVIASKQRDLIAAKIHVSEIQQASRNEAQTHGSPLKIKKSQLIENNLQQQGIQKARTKRLERKIEIILGESRVDMNYRRKIEEAIIQKINTAKNSPVSGFNIDLPKQSSIQIKRDLEEIFMNDDKKSRSNSIQRQNQILSIKQNLLKRRYSSPSNPLIVDQQQYKQSSKTYRANLIKRGLTVKQHKQPTAGLKFNMLAYSNKIKKQCIEKINKANKIKQQFMTIKAECENCHCYEDIEESGHAQHTKDIRSQSMKTGSAWRSAGRGSAAEESLEKLHAKNRIISSKVSQKYDHNMHLLQTKRSMMSKSRRRMSAPLL